MRILFADDHELLRDALKAYLEAEGEFTVRLASTVGDALAAITSEGPFDLVLRDFQIPGMDGLLGLRQVVAAQGAKPVMLLTGVATEGTATAAMRFGAVAVLSKTMPIEKLKGSIVSAINGNLAPAYKGASGQITSSDGSATRDPVVARRTGSTARPRTGRVQAQGAQGSFCRQADQCLDHGNVACRTRPLVSPS